MTQAHIIETVLVLLGLYILYNIGNHFEKIDREIENQNCHINRLYEKFDELPFKQKLSSEEKRMKKNITAKLAEKGKGINGHLTEDIYQLSPKVRKSNKSAK